MFKNNKYLLSTVALLLFLFLPFIFRSSFVKLELFPAIIMPSGSKKVNLTNEFIEFKNLNLYGLDIDTGQEKKLNHTIFFGQIPVRYLPSVVKNGFGIDPHMEKKHMIFKSNAIITKEDVAEGKKFLRNQLRGQNCQDSVLIVKNEISFFNIDAKSIDSVIIDNVKLYELY